MAHRRRLLRSRQPTLLSPGEKTGRARVPSRPAWVTLKAISAGVYHSLAPEEDGIIVARGDNADIELLAEATAICDDYWVWTMLIAKSF